MITDTTEQEQSRTVCANPLRAVPSLVTALIVAGALIGAALGVRVYGEDWSQSVRVIISLVPIPPFVVLMALLWRGVRRCDELHARMQLEALALTVVLTGLFTLIWGQLQMAEVLPPDKINMTVAVLSLAYVVSYALVSRRYR